MPLNWCSDGMMPLDFDMQDSLCPERSLFLVCGEEGPSVWFSSAQRVSLLPPLPVYCDTPCSPPSSFGKPRHGVTTSRLPFN